MKAKDLKNLTISQLEEKEQKITEEIFRLSFGSKTGQLESVKLIYNVKKDLARIKTIIREKKLGILP